MDFYVKKFKIWICMLIGVLLCHLPVYMSVSLSHKFLMFHELVRVLLSKKKKTCVSLWVKFINPLRVYIDSRVR
jgi:hypothetical protein